MALVSGHLASSRRGSAALELAVLLTVLLLAGLLRFQKLDWDAGMHQHPDERFLTDLTSRLAIPGSLGDYFATDTSSLNPYARGFNRLAYGQLPITLTRLAAESVDMTTYDSIHLVGRVLSAAADVGTVLLTWLLARPMVGRRAALLSAALLAVTVLHVQLAHFFAVDTFVTLFAAACLYLAFRARASCGNWFAGLAGLAAGLAMACKVSGAALLPVLLVFFIWPRTRRPTWAATLDGLTLFGIATTGAVLGFRLGEPYAFTGPAAWNLQLNTPWIQDKAYWANVSSGREDAVYMIQWVGTEPFVFALRSIVLWGMGPALGITALAGLFLGWLRLLRGGPGGPKLALVLIWASLNLVYFGGQYAKFMRYLLPAYFALVILASYLLVRAWDGTRASRGPLRWAGTAAAPLVVATTALWALAFSAVYTQPHSRIQASEWIYANVPAGRTLGVEHWDDRLPLPLLGSLPGQYRYTELALYDNETSHKREQLLQALDSSDFLILASRRLADSIPLLPGRFPLATAYYRLLFSGQLGFERVAEFQVSPALGPLRIDDSRAQEDFTVYDHPTVEIWAKRADYSSITTRELLGAVSLPTATPASPAADGKAAVTLG